MRTKTTLMLATVIVLGLAAPGQASSPWTETNHEYDCDGDQSDDVNHTSTGTYCVEAATWWCAVVLCSPATQFVNEPTGVSTVFALPVGYIYRDGYFNPQGELHHYECDPGSPAVASNCATAASPGQNVHDVVLFEDSASTGDCIVMTGAAVDDATGNITWSTNDGQSVTEPFTSTIAPWQDFTLDVYVEYQFNDDVLVDRVGTMIADNAGVFAATEWSGFVEATVPSPVNGMSLTVTAHFLGAAGCSDGNGSSTHWNGSVSGQAHYEQ